jgi:hypothetical protein
MEPEGTQEGLQLLVSAHEKPVQRAQAAVRRRVPAFEYAPQHASAISSAGARRTAMVPGLGWTPLALASY